MKPLTPLRIVYLLLAIGGTVVPLFFFTRWFEANDWSLPGMIDAWNVNDATSGLVWDLTFAAAALTVFVIAEAIARRDWWLLVSVPAIYGIGVSCGLPLHLFLRSRARADANHTGAPNR